ncbi:MAG TPA: hypothetical protein VF702_09880 [Allosphingosinicella sp.]|jgi:hypothetical protein
MLAILALMLASGQPQAAEAEVPTAASDPYRCSVAVHMDGLSGGMWRDFSPGRPDEFYHIQLNDPEPGGGPRASWSVDNRPPARPRVYGWRTGRPEADAFRYGPHFVSFGTFLTGRIRDGAIHARLYGDGVLAGTILAQGAKQTRRGYRMGAEGMSFSLSSPFNAPVIAALANARSWEAVLVDATGRELGRKTVRVPSPAIAEAEFNRARAELLRHRAEFLQRPTWNQDKPCSTFIEERDAPI